MSDRFGPSLDCPDCGETYSAGGVHTCTVPTKQCKECGEAVKITQMCAGHLCVQCYEPYEEEVRL